MPDPEPFPTTADLGLLRAIRAWGGGDFGRFSGRLSSAWRGRLAENWPPVSRERADASWEQLRLDHEASSRPDPARVHPSWYVRALKGESPGVQRVVAAHASESFRESIREGLGLTVADLAPDRAADPEALGWALTLWLERLVGDVPSLDADPPAVVALASLGPRDLARLVKVCGLVKHAFAIEGARPTPFDESIARFRPLDRVRVGFFRRHIKAADPRLIPAARLDLRAIEGDRRRAHLRVGLLTFARLLGAVETHRARWAIQHLPYPVARWMRSQTSPGLPTKAALAWETWVIEAAWSRLFAEGRLATVRAPGTESLTGGRS